MTKIFLPPTKTPFCYVTFANMNVCNMTKRLMKKKICRKGRYVTDKTFNKSSYPKLFTYWFCTLGPLCMHQTTHIKWKILVRFRYALQNFEMEIGKYRYWFRRKCLCACTKLTKKTFRKAVIWRNQRISTFLLF